MKKQVIFIYELSSQNLSILKYKVISTRKICFFSLKSQNYYCFLTSDKSVCLGTPMQFFCFLINRHISLPPPKRIFKKACWRVDLWALENRVNLEFGILRVVSGYDFSTIS